MIVKDDNALKYLYDYKDGKIKQGLKIGCKLDENLVLKRGEFNLCLGLDNVGKTFWLLWYFTTLAKIHKLKFIIWSGENRSEQLKRDIIEMWTGTKLKDLNKFEILKYNKEISEYFKFIDNNKLYNHIELFNLFANSDADVCAIDPYTGLNHNRKSVSQFDRNYNFCNSAREFCNKTKKTLFVSIHPQTEAARRVYPPDHLLNGHIQNPRKSDCEGGQCFPNRVDSLFVVHRYISHKELWPFTEVHVMKIKDRESGGNCTMLNEPLRFDYNNGLGFTIGGVNPLKNTENYG